MLWDNVQHVFPGLQWPKSVFPRDSQKRSGLSIPWSTGPTFSTYKDKPRVISGFIFVSRESHGLLLLKTHSWDILEVSSLSWEPRIPHLWTGRPEIIGHHVSINRKTLGIWGGRACAEIHGFCKIGLLRLRSTCSRLIKSMGNSRPPTFSLHKANRCWTQNVSIIYYDLCHGNTFCSFWSGNEYQWLLTWPVCCQKIAISVPTLTIWFSFFSLFLPLTLFSILIYPLTTSSPNVTLLPASTC